MAYKTLISIDSFAGDLKTWLSPQPHLLPQMDGEIWHVQDMPVGLSHKLNELHTEDCKLAVQQTLLEARDANTQVWTSLT